MHRRDAEPPREDRITDKIIGSAIVGLLINFNSPTIKSGLKRIVNNFSETFASQRLCGEVSDAPALP
jgi:hypothetical protein